jgi:polysaccharide biosynthesis/export protein
MKKIVAVLSILALFTACVPQKKIVYAQSPDDSKTNYEYTTSVNSNLTIEAFDQLYISILGIDQQGYNFFAQQKQNFNSLSEATTTVLSYTVNDSGLVYLPVVGKIKLKGLKLNEAEKLIADSCKSILNGPIVSVHFVNSTITILGEVSRPGTYIYNKEQLSIFRAIGLAGDINEFGNRRRVAVIREKGKTVEKHYIDLTKEDVFTSAYYFIHPNDVIYIEPLKIRRFGMKEYPFALIVSAVTSAFLILYYVKK